jgi:hypothetical protein
MNCLSTELPEIYFLPSIEGRDNNRNGIKKVLLLKISPCPFLPKRGIISLPLAKGGEEGFL